MMKLSNKTYIALGLSLVALTAIILLAMGRVLYCQCGTIKLWHGAVISAESSQHLSDYYSPSHFIHGILFYGVLALFARTLPMGWKVLIALAVEGAWEIFENTDFIINRYREATVALDYFGDSVINSLSDIGFMGLGFLFASRFPVWVSVVLVISLELIVGSIIRDNLALNIIMLIYPLEAIKTWQMGG